MYTVHMPRLKVESMVRSDGQLAGDDPYQRDCQVKGRGRYGGYRHMADRLSVSVRLGVICGMNRVRKQLALS